MLSKRCFCVPYARIIRFDASTWYLTLFSRSPPDQRTNTVRVPYCSLHTMHKHWSGPTVILGCAAATLVSRTAAALAFGWLTAMWLPFLSNSVLSLVSRGGGILGTGGLILLYDFDQAFSISPFILFWFFISYFLLLLFLIFEIFGIFGSTHQEFSRTIEILI